MGLGLKVLSPESENTKDIDIVFVHGLNGDSISTWTCNDPSPPCCWPRDILPKLLPSARIITFGYNANVIVDSIEGRVAEYAENLNSELMAERYETLDRPIVFVCHSMGGIVVKRALAVAQSRKDFNPLYQATHSIIFLATPHRGSDKAGWVSIASKLLRTLPFVNAGATRTTDELKTFSTVLQDINSDFIDRSEKFKIISFYEKQKVGGVGLIVEPWSAQMHIAAESHRIAVPRNHMGICRFAAETEDEFQTLFKQLRMLVHMAVRQVRETTIDRPKEQGLLSFPTSSKKRVLAIESSDSSPDKLQDERDPKARKSGVDDDDDDEMSHKMLPWRVPAFTSRGYFDRGPELVRIRQSVTRPNNAFFSIYGIGGIGKTQLALKYIDMYKGKYSHVFWLPAEDSVKIGAAIRALAVDLGLAEESISDEERCRHLLRDWLHQRKRWLIILDNVNSLSIHKDLLPSPVKGTVITTSRSSLLNARSIAMDGLKLEPLNDQQGGEYLLQCINKSLNKTNRDLASRISRELGGLPLALTTMAAYINDANISSLEAFLENYRQNRSKIISRSGNLEAAGGEYELTLATCWSMSMSPLHGELAGDLLGILALLDPDSIGENLLKDYAEDKKRRGIRPLRDLVDYWEAFRVLNSHGLLEKHEKESQSARTEPDIYVHRLVQEAWIRSLKQEKEIGKAFDNAILCMARVYPHQINGESMQDDFTVCRQHTQHVLSIERHYRSIFQDEDACTDLAAPTKREDLIALLADSGWFLYESGQWQAAKEMFKTAEAICHELFGDRPHRLTALIKNNIGVVHDSQNEPTEALEYAMAALTIREQCLDADDPEMGNSYSNYGHGLIDQGLYEEAQIYYLKAIAIHERSSTPSPDLLEGAYACMGKSMLYLNRLDMAEHWIQKAIEWHGHFKNANFFVAETLFALGSLRMKQDRWTEAEALIEESLCLRKQVIGPEARLVGVCFHHLGFIRAHEHNSNGAIDALREAVKIFRAPLETQPGLLQRSMIKLSSILAQLEDTEAIYESQNLKFEITELEKEKSGSVGLDLYDERMWDGMVQVAYRCF